MTPLTYRLEMKDLDWDGKTRIADQFNVTWPQPQSFPTPRVEIPETAFYRAVLLGSYSPDGYGHDSLFEPEPAKVVWNSTPQWSCRFWWFPRKAYMLAQHYSWGDTRAALMATSKLAWWVPDTYGANGWVCRGFRIGCDHQGATDTVIGNCLHEYNCPKCGLRWEIDSSG